MLENEPLQTDAPVLACTYFMPVRYTLLISFTQYFSLWGRIKCLIWEQDLTMIATYDLLVISVTSLLIWFMCAKRSSFSILQKIIRIQDSEFQTTPFLDYRINILEIYEFLSALFTVSDSQLDSKIFHSFSHSKSCIFYHFPLLLLK